jgi:hypothetical protein
MLVGMMFNNEKLLESSHPQCAVLDAPGGGNETNSERHLPWLWLSQYSDS